MFAYKNEKAESGSSTPNLSTLFEEKDEKEESKASEPVREKQGIIIDVFGVLSTRIIAYVVGLSSIAIGTGYYFWSKRRVQQGVNRKGGKAHKHRGSKRSRDDIYEVLKKDRNFIEMSAEDKALAIDNVIDEEQEQWEQDFVSEYVSDSEFDRRRKRDRDDEDYMGGRSDGLHNYRHGQTERTYEVVSGVLKGKFLLTQIIPEMFDSAVVKPVDRLADKTYLKVRLAYAYRMGLLTSKPDKKKQPQAKVNTQSPKEQRATKKRQIPASCYFGEVCTKKDCKLVHPKDKEWVKTDCVKGVKCSIVDCKMVHPRGFVVKQADSGCCHPDDCPLKMKSNWKTVCNTVCGGHHCTHWSECKPLYKPLKEEEKISQGNVPILKPLETYRFGNSFGYLQAAGASGWVPIIGGFFNFPYHYVEKSLTFDIHFHGKKVSYNIGEVVRIADDHVKVPIRGISNYRSLTPGNADALPSEVMSSGVLIRPIIDRKGDGSTLVFDQYQIHRVANISYDPKRRELKYTAHTEIGDCGALLIVTDKTGTQHIIGLHIAGDKHGFGSYAAAFDTQALKHLNCSGAVSL